MPRNDVVLIPRPSIDPELPTLSPLGRSAEVLRYAFQSFEHSVSPGGGLRKFLGAVGFVVVVGVAALPAVCIAAYIAVMLATLIANLLFAVIGGFVLYLVCKTIIRR